MRTERVNISPAMARNMLKKNKHNRSVFEGRVSTYAQDMAQGQWQENGQGIIFSTEGDLLDGQHRLAAILRANVIVPMLVVYDAPPDSFHTIDSGRTRSVQDVLATSNVPYSKIQAGASRLLLNYLSGASWRTDFSRKEILGFLRANDRLGAAANEFGGHIVKSGMPGGPILSVLALGLSGGDYKIEARDFVDGLLRGINLAEHDPRLVLRNWLLQNRAGRGVGSMTQGMKFSVVARAWNAYITKRPLKQLRALDPYPTLDALSVAGFDPDKWVLPERPRLLSHGVEIGVSLITESGGKRRLKVLDDDKSALR